MSGGGCACSCDLCVQRVANNSRCHFRCHAHLNKIKTRVSSLPGAYQLGEAGWTVSPRDPPVSAFAAVGKWVCSTRPGTFWMDSGGQIWLPIPGWQTFYWLRQLLNPRPLLSSLLCPIDLWVHSNNSNTLPALLQLLSKVCPANLFFFKILLAISSLSYFI